MSKIAKLIWFLFAMLVVSVGCGREKIQEVAKYDETYAMEQRNRYAELKDYLYEEYGEDLDEMKKDSLYDEYVRLNGMIQLGDESRMNNFKGTVDLDKQMIRYGEQKIAYEESEGTVVLTENLTELEDETLVRMVRLAKQQERKDREHNSRLLLTGGWLPVFTFLAGLIGWFKPRWVWYVEGGFRYKDVEPTDGALTLVRVQAIIAFGLTLLFVYLLINRMT